MADTTEQEQIPGNANRPIEAEASSDYGSETDSMGSDLTSIASSVFHYTYENGRRYHAYRAGKYLMPNDEAEQDRLDLMHHVFKICLQGDTAYTKLQDPTNILDVGTGTGIWAIEMGDLYPSARVVGTDVSPIQPDWVPPNVTFQVDDATDDWAFPEDHFDLIHIRCLGGSIRDWPAFFARALKHLKVGGKIEVAEGRTHLCCDDGTYSTESMTFKWVDEFHKIARKHGLEFDPFPTFVDIMKTAGFVDVVQDEKPCPIGSWPKDRHLKEIGKFFKHQFINGAVESYSMALFTRLGGWTEPETSILINHVKDEFNSKKFHVYTHCSYAVGTKPGPA